MDAKKKFFLFKQSDSFCAVPWNNIKILMDGSVGTCTYGKQTLGSVTTTSIEEVLDNFKPIKQEIIEGKKPNHCTLCHQYSDENYGFLRTYYNNLFKATDVDYDNVDEFTLSGIDLHWSSLCNLKCITCWHGQSSSIAKEEGKPVWHTPNESADKVIDYIVNHQFDLKEIYLSGGEPTMIHHNLRLLERLDKNINAEFRVNTNMMFDNDNKIVNELLKFKNVLFTISVDGLKDRFEYIRRGANWNKFISNLERLMPTHISWRVNSVLFVGTAGILIELQNFFRDTYSITDFSVNQEEMGHSNIKARNLPKKLKEQLIKDYDNYIITHNNQGGIKGNFTNCISELKQEKTEDYELFFENIDQKYGSNWKEIFTEL